MHSAVYEGDLFGKILWGRAVEGGMLMTGCPLPGGFNNRRTGSSA
ncbi:MAG: hypothetical protein AB7O38_10615 [Pirellulaceae bacterium]